MKLIFPSWFLLTTFLLALFGGVSGLDTGCDLDLMNAFKLEGIKQPQLNKPIDICGNVRDNCCTLADQMLIVKFWKEYSSPLLGFRVNKIIELYRAIFSFHHFFFGLKIEFLPAHLFRERAFGYLKQTCRAEYGMPQDLEEEDLVEISKAQGKKKGRQLTDGSVPDVVAQISMVPLTAKAPPTTSSSQAPRNLADSNSSPVAIPENQLKNMQKIESLKQRFQETIHASLQKVTDFVSRRLNKIDAMKQKLQDRLNLVSHRLEVGGSDPRLLAHEAPKTSEKGIFDFKKFNELYKNKEIPVSQKTLLEEQRAELQRTIELLDANAKKILKYQNKALMKKLNIDFDNDKFAKFIEDVQSARLPSVPGSISVIRRRLMPPTTPIEYPRSVCTKTRNTVYRRLYFVNQAKFRYCDNVLWAVKKLHLSDFVAFLPDVHQSLLRLGSLRRSLYCAICDYSTQKYIDFKNKAVFYNQDFCEAYIWEFAEYFRWKDILFVEYLHNLFQTISCFDSDGRATAFPFKTMIDHQFQKSFFYRRCFDAINTEDWFKYCHFICREFKYDTLSQMIEGDLHFLKEVVSRMVSFLRKQNVSLSRLNLEKLDKITKVDLLRGHQVPGVAQEIDEMIQTEFEKQLKTPPKKRRPIVKVEPKEDADRFITPSGDFLRNEKEEESRKLSLTRPDRVLAETKSDEGLDQYDRAMELLAHPSRGTPPPRSLSGNDFNPQAVYSSRINIGQINNLSVFFYKDMRGINPMIIDGLLNFDFDVDEFLKTYAVKSSAEYITSDVMKIVLGSIANEKDFNAAIQKLLMEADGSIYTPEEEFAYIEQRVREGANPLRNYTRKRLYQTTTAVSTSATPQSEETGYKGDGMPELDFILN